MSTADELIRHLGLQPHPKEGGFFRETYRAAESFAPPALPGRYVGTRSASTAIYYLLTPKTFSALHRLQTDEIFHFYLGDPVRMLQLHPDGSSQTLLLGNDVLAGQHPQVVVPRGVWQGSLLEPGGAFALLGCTVAPGFDYVDYEHGNRDALSVQYPSAIEMIRHLTQD
ncbi:MAG: cupin domain-containing protein [Planctomycetes bacterium]|nr:cupin domain-containing protein [Planctomycetota bacterium]